MADADYQLLVRVTRNEGLIEANGEALGDHEKRIRELEADRYRLAGKLSAFAVFGSAIATAVMQLLLKGLVK